MENKRVPKIGEVWRHRLNRYAGNEPDLDENGKQKVKCIKDGENIYRDINMVKPIFEFTKQYSKPFIVNSQSDIDVIIKDMDKHGYEFYSDDKNMVWLHDVVKRKIKYSRPSKMGSGYELTTCKTPLGIFHLENNKNGGLVLIDGQGFEFVHTIKGDLNEAKNVLEEFLVNKFSELKEFLYKENNYESI